MAGYNNAGSGGLSEESLDKSFSREPTQQDVEKLRSVLDFHTTDESDCVVVIDDEIGTNSLAVLLNAAVITHFPADAPPIHVFCAWVKEMWEDRLRLEVVHTRF